MRRRTLIAVTKNLSPMFAWSLSALAGLGSTRAGMGIFNPMNKSMTFAEWQQFARGINARAKALQDSLHDVGWKLAATVGIPHCGCSLHNASIDDKMTGWCAGGNWHRLQVAKKANHLVNDWTVSNMAERITRRAWNNVVWPSNS